MPSRKKRNETRKTVRFRGREEAVIEQFNLRGRRYFALARLSRRGAFRVFDPHAGPHGDYRALYRLKNSQTSFQRIETIRRLGGKTANRNFPQLVDYVRQKDDLFIVLSWIWGTPLSELIQSIRNGKSPQPSVRETVRLARGLAHGIGHYHRVANLVHGDISPANLIVTSGTKHLVLVDFGSAWPAEETARREIGDGATRPYAAPERLSSEPSEDFRADIFSLSVIAYEMLTGEIPFDGAGGAAGLPENAKHFSGVPTPPSRMLSRRQLKITRRGITRLDDYFRRGLALDPNQRFPSRRAWLSAWDALHGELQKGSRLSTHQERWLGWIESLTNRLKR